ncbi:tandem-95 repeat protein [Limibaculum sp. M0105]|uniref:Tandem-95 repeat protein n=1 Tax=Thermohalobaculum xanthum TaxID=2753746 RepID=A0A8J7M9C0_9RHOB|nr:Ig-like domain-containing protein [Thermohalobaculum xanthum]MBK0400132.1 tandem-95 repeat protein [Thermohalobaculum xanthum]
METYSFEIGGTFIEAAPLLAFNIGGAEYTSTATGQTFLADPGISGGQIQNRDRPLEIAGTEDDRLFQSYGFGDFSYDFAVPEDGQYVVELWLTEPWFKAAGKRVFNVAVEGSVPASFQGIDPYAVAGLDARAITLTSVVTVDDGTLDIDFDSLVNNAIISAIAIYQVVPQYGAADDTASTDEDQAVLIDVLANDTAGVTLQSVGAASAGTAVIQGGAILYMPGANFNGVDGFTYTVIDGEGTVSTAQVTVTVAPVNDAPEGLGLSSNTVSELDLPGTVIGTVSASDPDGDTVTFAVSDARFSVNALGQLVVAAGADLSVPSDTSVPVTITAMDGNGGTATLETSILIADVPLADLANDDAASLDEDGTVLIDVLANDEPGITITGYTQGAHGSVTTDGGMLRYTPVGDYYGPDSFSYTVAGALGADEASVSISVLAVNDAPGNLGFTGSSVNADAAPGTVVGIVSATDPDGDPITFSVDDARFSITADGSLVVAAGASFDPVLEPQIELVIGASDGIAPEVTASYAIQVNGGGALSVFLVDTASDQIAAQLSGGAVVGLTAEVIDVLGLYVTVPDDSPYAGSVGSVRLSLDGDIVRTESSAPYALFGDSNGDFRPGSIGAGPHVLTIEIFSGSGAGGTLLDSQQISFQVNSITGNIAEDDVATTEADVPIVIDVLANDYAPNGDAVLEIVGAPLNGTVEIVGDEILYTPFTGITGTDSFRYAFTSGGSAAEGAVTVTTLPVAAGTSLAAEQLHLAWIDDAATTLTVVWRFDDGVAATEVQYRQQGETGWTADQSALRPSGTVGGELWEATLRGLAPGTVYEFRVRLDDGSWSEVYDATTAPAAGTQGTFDLVFFADTGLIGRTDGLTAGTEQVRDEIAALDPTLLLGGGDYAYYNTDKRFGTLEATIDAWFDQWQEPLGQAPFMTVYGNHEVFLGEGFDQWNDRLPQPEENDLENGRFYSFDVGDAHFVMILMADEDDGLTSTQLAWIEADILAAQAAGADWIIPVMHAAPYSDGTNHGDALEARDDLAPLFESLNVDLVLTTHDQSYLRTFPLVNGSSTLSETTNVQTTADLSTYYTESDGVVWMKVSPGGKLSNINGSFSDWETEPAPSYTAVRDNTLFHYAQITFDGDQSLTVEVLGVDGLGSAPVVVDSFQFISGARASFTTNDTAVTDEDVAVLIDVLANDAAGTSLISIGQAAHGSVSIAGAEVLYTPDPDFNGTDMFTYVGTDGSGASNTVFVEVTVNPVNDAPSNLALAGTTIAPDAAAGTLVGMLFATDIDGDAVTFSIDDARFTVNGAGQLVVAEGADLALAVGTELPVTITASDGKGGIAMLNETLVIDDASAGPVALAAINVGGGAYISSETGISYAPDPGISGGTISLRQISNAISGTLDDVLYQTYGFGTFSYDIALPEAATYIAEFHFIEPWASGPDDRVFDISLEGVAPAELSSIDVYALAGGRYTAFTLSAAVVVDDGTLDIDLLPSENNAILSAITIYHAGEPLLV